MYRYVVLMLTLCFSGTLADTAAPVVPHHAGRIVGGVDTTINEFPHQISVRENGLHRCSGSILSENIILICAHCVDTLSGPGNLTLVAGNTYLSDKSVALPVLKYIIHEGYTRTTTTATYFENDVAILVLQGRLVYSSTIQPIELADERPPVGSQVLLSGWGQLSETGSRPDRLQMVELDIISNLRCKSIFIAYTVDDSMICTYVEGGVRDACHGDSGSPLIYKGKQVGVVSWGIGCARKLLPGVCASVSDLKPWIMKVAAENAVGWA